MKKILFLMGMLAMTTSLALAQSNYTAESDGTYTYTGSPVDVLSVDFTTWSTSDLPATLSDDMAAAESRNMAFVKWKIASRPCGDKGTVNALFNNNAADFGGSPANTATSNKPRIYLPTTSGSVGDIKVFCGGGNQWIKVFYKDDDHTAWTQASSIQTAAAYADYSLSLNSNGQTTIYLEYTGTGWIAIANLELEIAEPIAPEESVYELNTETGIYAYTGEPVDTIGVNFAEWATSDLPETFTDDMVLAQKNGLGFVKWKIATYKSGDINQNVLFNNDANDFGGSPKNNATTNPPTIYFPKTSRGIKSITVTYFPAAAAHWFKPFYKDNGGEQSPASVSLPASGTGLQTAVWEINSTGPTTLYLRHTGTTWPRIASIVFTLEEESPATGTEMTQPSNKSIQKVIENGKLVIIKNGVRYNSLGVQF